MTELTFKPVLRRVFHPSDFSAASDAAFAHALCLALAQHGELTILHTDPDPADQHWQEFPQVRATLERWGLLPPHSLPSAVSGLGLKASKVAALHSAPVEAILHYLREHRHDIIVLATHQYEGLARLSHKPVATPVALGSGALTLFLPPAGKGFVSPADGTVSLRRVLIPVDTSPLPQLAVAAAAALAEALNCPEVTFTLWHVGPPDSFPAIPEIPERAGWTWQRETAQGRVEQSIIDAAQTNDSDLIVMATAGHQGFMDALRGSTTERIVRAAPCPVLAVPAGAFAPEPSFA